MISLDRQAVLLHYINVVVSISNLMPVPSHFLVENSILGKITLASRGVADLPNLFIYITALAMWTAASSAALCQHDWPSMSISSIILILCLEIGIGNVIVWVVLGTYSALALWQQEPSSIALPNRAIQPSNSHTNFAHRTQETMLL